MNKKVKFTKKQIAHIIWMFYKFKDDIDYDASFEIELNRILYCLYDGSIGVRTLDGKINFVIIHEDDFPIDTTNEKEILNCLRVHRRIYNLGGE